MAMINLATKEIHAKIAYYGTGLSGKTTNLNYIQAQLPAEAQRELLSISTEHERTLFFDFLPVEIGQMHGFTLCLHLYTVPGQVQFERTRNAILSGADGIVFVADAQESRLEENLESLCELADNLQRQDNSLATFPIVMQYNKVDLPDALPVAVLDHYLNSIGAPRYAAVAVDGSGVLEALQAIATLVVRQL